MPPIDGHRPVTSRPTPALSPAGPAEAAANPAVQVQNVPSQPGLTRVQEAAAKSARAQAARSEPPRLGDMTVVAESAMMNRAQRLASAAQNADAVPSGNSVMSEADREPAADHVYDVLSELNAPAAVHAYDVPSRSNAPAADHGEAVLPELNAPAPQRGENHPNPQARALIGQRGVEGGVQWKGMTHSQYQNETHTASFRGAPSGWEKLHNGQQATKAHLTNIYTHYQTPAEQAASKLGVADGADGRARLLRDGAVLDTTRASGTGTNAVKGADGRLALSGAQRHIYATGLDGQTRSVDPWAARTTLPDTQNPVARDGRANEQLGFVNHSSLVQGDRVAAAGDMRVVDGRVELISNNSGHYSPTVPMLHQAVGAMAGQNVLDVARPQGERTRVEVHRGENKPPIQVDALTFLAASQGSADIARAAFGDLRRHAPAREEAKEDMKTPAEIIEENIKVTMDTVAKKSAVVDEINARTPRAAD